MRVRVKLIANYMKLLPPGTPGNTIELECRTGATIGDLLQPLGVPLDDSTVLLLNGRQAEADALLSEDDTVTAFSAIAGGSELGNGLGSGFKTGQLDNRITG